MKILDLKKVDTRKVTGTVIGGIFFLFCILFFTYAYYVWESDKSNVALAIEDLSIECVLGTNVSATNIGPVLNLSDGVKANFSVANGTNDASVISLTLNITSISENLQVESFKYALVYDTTGGTAYDYDNPILTGSFSNLVIGANVITDALTIQGSSTYSYQFIVYIDGSVYNDPNMQNNSLVAELELGNCGGITSNEPVVATEKIQNLYNDGSSLTTVNIGGSTDNPSVSMNATQGIMLDNNGEYRYYGANPNNYVNYNGELWRIISVSNVKSSTSDTVGEQRIKLIRADSIGEYSWDSSASTVNSGYGVNDWTQADLNTELNSLYYSKQSGTCYNEYNNATGDCDFTSIGLDSTAKSMIGDVLWYLGSPADSLELYADDFYNAERGTSVYGCSTDDGACPRATNWTGKVGLMYGSDYTYAVDFSLCSETTFYYVNSECRTNDWLYDSDNEQWTLTPGVSSPDYVYYVKSSGELIDDYIAYGAAIPKAIRPTVYLKSDVFISGGSGTSGEPYQLSMGPTLLSEMEVGSYVAYTGNNGCSGKSCNGQNANYVSDSDMGYCYSSDNKFSVSGWRVAYIEDGSAYLVSAGSPECMCTNTDGTTSNSDCSGYLAAADINKHFTNLDNVALRYCNPNFAHGGVCNSTTVWSFDSTDFQKITGNALSSTSCFASEADSSCGYGNDLIDNGGYYWATTLYASNEITSFFWYPSYRYTAINASSELYGVRPVIKLATNVVATGGSGTSSDPYQLGIDTTYLKDVETGSYVTYDFGGDTVSSNVYRLAYVEEDIPYLISASTVTTMCTNADGSYSASDCTENAFDYPGDKHSANIAEYLANMKGNTTIASDLLYDTTSSSYWNVSFSDFEKITGSTATSCISDTTAGTCGKDNDLIDIGISYWFSDYLDSGEYSGYGGTDYDSFYWLERGGSLTAYISYYNILDNLTYDSFGLRPVLKMKSNVVITGGSGTSGDPYVISLGG